MKMGSETFPVSEGLWGRRAAMACLGEPWVSDSIDVQEWFVRPCLKNVEFWRS